MQGQAVAAAVGSGDVGFGGGSDGGSGGGSDGGGGGGGGGRGKAPFVVLPTTIVLCHGEISWCSALVCSACCWWTS